MKTNNLQLKKQITYPRHFIFWQFWVFTRAICTLKKNIKKTNQYLRKKIEGFKFMFIIPISNIRFEKLFTITDWKYNNDLYVLVIWRKREEWNFVLPLKNKKKKIVMVEKSNKIYISRFIRISIYILRNLNLYNAVECFDCLDK